MSEQLQIACGPKGRDGKRLVICTLGVQSHRHRVDADDDLQRRKWRERIVGVFNLPEDSHYHLEEQLIASADGEDERARTGWEPLVVCMNEVEADKPAWLWDSRILAGGLNELMGDAGLGKSTITIDIAARLSRGDTMPPHNAPDGTFTKRSTLFVTCEDALQFVLKPRLLAAGADPTRVHALSGVALPDTDEQRQIQLLKDLAVIEKTVTSRAVSLVVVDPYSGFIDDNCNINSDPDNRKILGPLAQMAERTNTSVLLIRHLNKKEGQSSQYRGGGSVAITAACRSSLLIAEDPDDIGQRVLATNKCNLAKHPQSLRLSIEDAGDASLVRWGDSCDLSAGDLLKAGKSDGGGKLDVAKEIIADILGHGPCGSNEVEEACTDAGVSRSTFHRARKDLGVVSEKTDFDGQWLMTLPSRNGAASYDEF